LPVRAAAEAIGDQETTGAASSLVTRRRAGLLLVVLVATSLLAILGSLLWPEPAVGDWYTYQDIAPIRERWWAVLTALSVGLVLNVPAQALAALILTPDRGAMWTAGASLMWLGHRSVRRRSRRLGIHVLLCDSSWA
jgi:putative effector of murein hydrolase